MRTGEKKFQKFGFLGAGFGPQITPLNPQNLKSEINTDSDRWSVTLNVKYFAPEDLKVKTVGASVEVKAKHEEKQDEAGAIRYNLNYD